MVLYGQVVAGPPGSGKTTYCTGMQEYLRLLGRNAWVINLDPANEVPSKTKKVTTKDSDAATGTNENENERKGKHHLDGRGGVFGWAAL